MSIRDLFERERDYWLKENRELFGLYPIKKYDTLKNIQKILDKSCEDFWNTNSPCLLAQALVTLDRDNAVRVDKNFRFEFNPISSCVDVYGKYYFKDVITEKLILSMPSVTEELTWLIGNLDYVPRVTAIKNNRDFVIRYAEDYVVGENWRFDIPSQEFTLFNDETEEDIFNRLTERSKLMLGLIEEELSLDNFKETLSRLPIIAHNSIFNYNFARMEYFKDLVLNTKKWAKPLSGRVLGINQLLLSQAKQVNSSYEGSLVLSSSKVFSLENFRTSVNIFNGSFKPTFSYTDTVGFFDSFKTVTTGQAGRQRLLLDNIVIKNGMLWVVENEEEKSMFEYFFNPQEKRLSCLSEAPFCNNDKPKRIMMNAKLSAQSCSLEGELDDFTHRILARVGFCDIEGYSFGDSIIISESFAKRLVTKKKELVVVSLEANSLEEYFPKVPEVILSSWRNIKIEREEEIGLVKRLLISYEVPFRLGDKITNLHGAKGTVGLILPDDEMPMLTQKAGNLEPGPLEVLISGFSTMRRGSLGQIFEAWALANDIPIKDDSLFYKYLDYKDNMVDFSNKSTIAFRGNVIKMPIGLNMIMRIDQFVAKKVSISTRDSKKKLKLGEMEKLGLLANGYKNILKELSIRDISKNVGGYYLLNKLENEGIVMKPKPALNTATIFKTLGYDLRLNGKSIERSDYSQLDFALEDIFNFNNLEE